LELTFRHHPSNQNPPYIGIYPGEFTNNRLDFLFLQCSAFNMTTKMAKKEYHRLSGTQKGFLIGRYTLWKAVDHLLHIYSRAGLEGYKRFYFNDIQDILPEKQLPVKFLVSCWDFYFCVSRCRLY